MAIEVRSISERQRPRFVVKRAGRAVRLGVGLARERKRKLFLAIAAMSALMLCAAPVFLVYSYITYSKLVDERLAHGYLTSRAGIYAAPRSLRVGQRLTPDGLATLLRRAGYIENAASNVWSGSFTVRENQVELHTRRMSGSDDAAIALISFDREGRINSITNENGPLELYTLEPELLTTDAGVKGGKHEALAYGDIPAPLVRAILSIEDRRFFEHRGVDLFGIGRALLRNAGDERMGQGGSTITQQLVKNTYLSPERTLRRKFAEAMISFTLERRLSKEDIFALYCNEIYLGQRSAVAVRGVEQAAQVFFGKELKELSLSEAAAIAGMIQSPSRYAPDRHPEAARSRRNVVLGAMLRDGAITREEAQRAVSEQLTVAPARTDAQSVAPYFIDYVNRVVESRLETASAADERSLRIYTTLDPDLQQLAEAAIKRQLERLERTGKPHGAKPEAALVALDPKTGDVLAMVGGSSYADTQLNRATDARRQPGSVFKPLVYAAALESGISPLSKYADAPREFSYDRRSVYRPSNYGNSYSMQDVTMRTGLIKSLNVVTVDLAMQTGLGRVAGLAQSLGLQRPAAYPSLALGTTEATPLELAAAYTAFANLGQRVEPNVIAHASDASGTDVLKRSQQTSQVIAPASAFMLTDMLAGVIDHGTARAARGIVRKTAVAGKTGTSRDGWFIGYTPNLVCAVWVGYDDNKQLGLTGAEAALPVWTEFVKNSVELRPELGGESFERPAGVTYAEIDPETGMLSTPSCPARERIALAHAFMPALECFKHTEALPLNASLEEESGNNALEEIAESDADGGVPGHQRALPNRSAASETSELQSQQGTTVESRVRGRSTLVNEMRVGRSP